MDDKIKTKIQNHINENELYINNKTKVTIDELKTSNTSWLTNYMSK